MRRVDVAVIGAGPAGMSTATVLADAGLAVVVIDEQPNPGGQIYRGVEGAGRDRPELGEDYAAGLSLVEALRASAAELLLETAVFSVEDAADGVTLRCRGPDGAPFPLASRHVVVATGAQERPMPFPGWTLPGVMGVGAAQTLLKASALVPAAAPVLAGSGPLLYLFAWQLLRAGRPPRLIADTRPGIGWTSLRSAPRALPELARGLGWMRDLRRARVRVLRGVTGLAAVGSDGVETLQIRSGGSTETVETGLVLTHDGVIPSTAVPGALGCRLRWNDAQECFQPVTDATGRATVPGISITGDGAGILGALAAAAGGEVVGGDVAGQLGAPLSSGAAAAARVVDRARRVRAVLDALFPPRALPVDDRTLVCRCEEVTLAEVRAVAADGCSHVDQCKAMTRTGMGPCQGRWCESTVRRVLAAAHGVPLAEPGRFTTRFPVRPVTVGDLAATAETL